MAMFALRQALFAVDPTLRLQVDSLCILPWQHTVILGPNGSGKSALAAALAGQLKLQSGDCQRPAAVGWVSTRLQQDLLEQEKRKGAADLLDVWVEPTSARQLLMRDHPAGSAALQQRLLQLSDALQLTARLDTPFLALSTGETRKLLLIRAVLAAPAALVLDEPYQGLDQASVQALSALLAGLHQQLTLILVLNRPTEIPPFTAKLVYCQAMTRQQPQAARRQTGEPCLHPVIDWQTAGAGLSADDRAAIRQLSQLQQPAVTLPACDQTRDDLTQKPDQTLLFRLTDGKVQYGDRVVFSGLNWQVRRGEHWQISGPNGSGKTCLLQLISGDNPHCYTNQLEIFGRRRGSGESIWDIKQHLGIVSNSLHLQYRVNCPVLHVVLSGYYDSIGLYQQPSERQLMLARQWLALLGMAELAGEPFRQLSFGDQRLLLIARAMVKHPRLLILDEPCNGLDALNRQKVLALIELLAAQGRTTLLYVSHQPEDRIQGISRLLDLSMYQPGQAGGDSRFSHAGSTVS